MSKIHVETCHIGPATDSESSRYALADVLISGADSGAVFATATDGRQLSVATIESDDLDLPARVPGRMFRRPPNKGLDLRNAGDGWRDLALKNQQTKRATNGRFPKTGDILPEVSARFAVAVDANLLARCANAIGDGRITLFLDLSDDGAPIAVLGTNGVGCVMPLSVDSRIVQERTARYTATRREYCSSVD